MVFLFLHADIRSAFHFFDTNGDGLITTEELATAMQYLGLQASNSDLLNMIKQADEDGELALSISTFLVTTNRWHCPILLKK